MAHLFLQPIGLALSNVVDPLSGAKAYFYDAGTSTPRATYPTAADASAHTNAHTVPVLATSFGRWPAIFLDPAGGNYKVDLKSSAGVSFAGYPIDNLEVATAATDLYVLLNPATAGEDTAAVTIVNHMYADGVVDRYGTNTVPGTTDMSAAFNAAYQVAKQTGCRVQFGATAPYRLNSPVNCTQMRGVVTDDYSSCSVAAGNASVIIAHTGHGFDLSASTEMIFNNLSAKNLSGIVPKTLFFMARNAAGSGCGVHRFNNIRTYAAFENVFYEYGSEENNHNDCFIYNSHPGSALFNHNSSNPSGYSSSFMTIATGVQSAAVHRHRGGDYFNLGNSGLVNECVFQLEGASDFSYEDGLWYCAFGLAYVRVSGAIASNVLKFDTIRGEVGGGPKPTYGITVVTTATTGVDSHVRWIFNNVQADSSSYLLHFADTAEIKELRIGTGCGAVSGYLLDVYNMSNSVIEHSTSVVTGRTGGTVTSNTFVGTRSSVAFNGAHTLNTGFDQGTGRTWEDDDSYAPAATACTGAITASVQHAARKQGARVTITLPPISAVATAAASFNLKPDLPAAYRPSADRGFDIPIQDNGSRVAGHFLITSAGVMTVSKFAGGNFTAAGGAGLPQATEVTFNQ